MKQYGFYSIFIMIISCICGCQGIQTDFTGKTVMADASLWGCSLQTGFDPITGTPLPKLEFGKIDATYVSIPSGDSPGNVEIAIGTEGEIPDSQSSGISRKITIKVQRE